MPEWRVGARYDRLDPGTVDYGANGVYSRRTSFNPQRYSVMFDWTPSEFSRFRVQSRRASCGRMSPTTSSSSNTS